MFSIPDILVVSVVALLLFGPERLPKVMRQAGRVMREVQSTSQSFIAEMERAAEISEADTVSPKVQPTGVATDGESEEPAEHESHPDFEARR